MVVDVQDPSAQLQQPPPALDQVQSKQPHHTNLISPQQLMVVVDNVPAPIPDTSKDEEFARALQEEEIVS